MAKRTVYSKFDGYGLREAQKVPQAHGWKTDGSSFLSGKDCQFSSEPTRARMARGRPEPKKTGCRAGCRTGQTLNHVLQICLRSHSSRISRHNAFVYYLQRSLSNAVMTCRWNRGFGLNVVTCLLIFCDCVFFVICCFHSSRS